MKIIIFGGTGMVGGAHSKNVFSIQELNTFYQSGGIQQALFTQRLQS